jgi:hypothetical protein
MASLPGETIYPFRKTAKKGGQNYNLLQLLLSYRTSSEKSTPPQGQ